MPSFWATPFRPLVFFRTQTNFRLDQNADAAGPQAGAYPAGRCGYRKFLRDLSKRIGPITSVLRKGVQFEFTPAMEIIVRDILAELAAPPILVFSD